MISLQQSGELIYHDIPSSISLTNQQDIIVNLHDHHVLNMEGINPNLAASKAGAPKRKRQNRDREHMHRKLVRREIEKRRREDLSKLYASLGGLLPPNFVKGKRSIMDCTNQAVNYIKHMKENIEILSAKRDKIKNMGGKKSVKELSLLNHVIPNAISISSCNGRSFEIQINISCSIEDGFPLSEILKALFEEGLDVINCTSTKLNKRLLHSIRSEASDTTLTDLSMLQQRLTVIANTIPAKGYLRKLQH